MGRWGRQGGVQNRLPLPSGRCFLGSGQELTPEGTTGGSGSPEQTTQASSSGRSLHLPQGPTLKGAATPP